MSGRSERSKVSGSEAFVGAREQPHVSSAGTVRVQIVDPSAYTPPYDHALCDALARRGAQVELITSRFAYGPVAPAERYARRELFYLAARGPAGGRLRMALKLAEHVPDMLRYRRVAQAADVVHFQWLSVQQLDGRLLPHKPLVLTAHDVLPREPRAGQMRAQQRLYERFDAIVVHSEHGRKRLVEELHVPEQRVHVIPHGVFTHLAQTPPGRPPARAPFQTDKPVVLCFGLMRPYKGIDVLLRAWSLAQADAGDAVPPGAVRREMGSPARTPVPQAELWIAGMPKMDVSSLRAASGPDVRWQARFVTDEELPAYFERADLVVLPYLQAEQSGVLFTALAFGKPLLLSDVGGFPEMTATGAARIVPAGDAQALGAALRQLLSDRDALAQMAAAARRAAAGRYSWDSIAQAHLQLYESLL